MFFLSVVAADHGAGHGGSIHAGSLAESAQHHSLRHLNHTRPSHGNGTQHHALGEAEDGEERMNPFLAVLLLYGIMLLMVAAQGGLYYW